MARARTRLEATTARVILGSQTGIVQLILMIVRHHPGVKIMGHVRTRFVLIDFAALYTVCLRKNVTVTKQAIKSYWFKTQLKELMKQEVGNGGLAAL